MAAAQAGGAAVGVGQASCLPENRHRGRHSSNTSGGHMRQFRQSTNSGPFVAGWKPAPRMNHPLQSALRQPAGRPADWCGDTACAGSSQLLWPSSRRLRCSIICCGGTIQGCGGLSSLIALLGGVLAFYFLARPVFAAAPRADRHCPAHRAAVPSARRAALQRHGLSGARRGRSHRRLSRAAAVGRRRGRGAVGRAGFRSGAGFAAVAPRRNRGRSRSRRSGPPGATQSSSGEAGAHAAGHALAAAALAAAA